MNDADDRYIVITFTDGHENASREWTKEKVAALLKEREALGNWTFAFFGAEIDAWGEAGDMGYAAGNTSTHRRVDTLGMMSATGRAASVMSRSSMRRSAEYAATANAVMLDPKLSDAEIERRLAEGDVDDASVTS